MTGRARVQSLAASPTMVGAITTLIIIVAVFLAYNADKGLPFVPTYRVSAEMPNAARVGANNEVRIGGQRIGVVESLEPIQNAQTGEAAAKLNLQLDEGVRPIPEDSTIRVRYRSSFGLKYVEIEEGEGAGLPEGGTLAIDQAIPQTEFDDIANTFDTATRENSRLTLEGFGAGFAGRGASLNQAIENLNPLFGHLRPVANVLANPVTRLERFFPALANAARQAAPVATEQAEMFGFMATTFAAIASDPDALRETISEGPPTLETGIRSLPAQRPFLAKLAIFSEELRPGVRELRRALPTLNGALRIGTPVLNRTPPMNRALRGAMIALDDLVSQPETKRSLARLTDTFGIVDPLIDFVSPHQTVCNYWNLHWAMLSEHLSERDQVGFTERVTLISPPGTLTPTNRAVSSLSAYGALQANGRRFRNDTPPFNVLDGGGDPPHPGPGPDRGIFEPQEVHTPDPFPDRHGQPVLQAEPFAPVVGPGGTADCAAGQTGYMLGNASETSPNPALRNPGQSQRNPAIAILPGQRGPTLAPKSDPRFGGGRTTRP